MIPSKHANALYFTPRTPWGTRVPRRALRSHMQASEDAPLQPGQKRPNILGQLGSGIATGAKVITHGIATGAKGIVHGVGNALKQGSPIFGLEAEKAGSERGSVGLVAGWHLGNKQFKSAANDEEYKEQGMRADLQRQGMKLPADEEESSQQESTHKPPTDQEIEASQRAWAKRNPAWIDQKVQGSVARMKANTKNLQ